MKKTGPFQLRAAATDGVKENHAHIEGRLDVMAEPLATQSFSSHESSSEDDTNLLILSAVGLEFEEQEQRKRRQRRRSWWVRRGHG